MSHKWCHCVIFYFFFPQRLLTRSLPSAPPDAWEQVKMIRQCFHSISNENLIEHSVSNCVSDCSVWLWYFGYCNMPQEFRSHCHKNFRPFCFSVAFLTLRTISACSWCCYKQSVPSLVMWSIPEEAFKGIRRNTEKDQFCLPRWLRKEHGSAPNGFSTVPSMNCLLELTSDAEMDNTSQHVLRLLTVSWHFSKNRIAGTPQLIQSQPLPKT